MKDLNNITIKSAKAYLDSGDVTSSDLVRHYLDNISDRDDQIKSYLTVTVEEAYKKAEEHDKGFTSKSYLSGIPVMLKDNIITSGVRTTAASKILEHYVPVYDATVTKRLKDCPLLGKGNMDVFAFGASTENSGYFPTHNPWNLNKVPGGSSGGPAAAVASDLALFAIGTDTGGSIRQPASFCGIVGLKPTYGRCSRYGLIAMGSSFDCPGPLTKNVEDAAIVLEHIAGVDEMDGTTVNVPLKNYSDFKDVDNAVKGLKIGLPKEFFSKGLDPKVKDLILTEIKRFQKMGAEIVEVTLPYSAYSLAVYYVLVPSEISTNMSRYDGIRYGYKSLDKHEDLFEMYVKNRSKMEPELKRRIMLGTYALSSGYYDAYYNKASKVRSLIIKEFNQVFENVDVLITPTSPTVAFNLGEKSSDPLSMYLADIYTTTANIVGIPSISIPCGLVDKMPVGLQIMGKNFDEKTILNLAYVYERDLLGNTGHNSFVSAYMPR